MPSQQVKKAKGSVKNPTNSDVLPSKDDSRRRNSNPREHPPITSPPMTLKPPAAQMEPIEEPMESDPSRRRAHHIQTVNRSYHAAHLARTTRKFSVQLRHPQMQAPSRLRLQRDVSEQIYFTSPVAHDNLSRLVWFHKRGRIDDDAATIGAYLELKAVELGYLFREVAACARWQVDWNMISSLDRTLTREDSMGRDRTPIGVWPAGLGSSLNGAGRGDWTIGKARIPRRARDPVPLVRAEGYDGFHVPDLNGLIARRKGMKLPALPGAEVEQQVKLVQMDADQLSSSPA